MIYIFKGCQACCEVPGSACRACGKQCDRCSKNCGECFALPLLAFGACFQRLGMIHNRPLGSFVFLSWFLNGISIVGSVMTLATKDAELVTCEKPMKMFVVAQLFNAFIHSGFVLYMQTRLVEGLAGEDNEFEDQDFTAAETLEELKQIAVYDIGFCLYFLLFFFSVGWNITGMTWAFAVAGCDPGHWPATCTSIGLLYNFLVISVSCCHPCALWMEEMGCCFLCKCCGCPVPSGSDGKKGKKKLKTKTRSLNEARQESSEEDETDESDLD